MICKCGHLESKHRRDNAKDMYCSECWDNITTPKNPLYKIDCVYHNFKLDNLKYLEQKYKESIQ